MNILVTGANGQLGNEMRRVSARSSDHYIFTDVVELDITDLAAIQKITINNQVDVIVNCAAYTNVNKAEEDEATANLINNLAVKYLAIAAKHRNQRRKTDQHSDQHCIWKSSDRHGNKEHASQDHRLYALPGNKA